MEWSLSLEWHCDVFVLYGLQHGVVSRSIVLWNDTWVSVVVHLLQCQAAAVVIWCQVHYMQTLIWGTLYDMVASYCSTPGGLGLRRSVIKEAPTIAIPSLTQLSWTFVSFSRKP